MATIDFIFDFGSPNAYISHKLLPGIAERTGAKINVIPCLLGGIFKTTGNQAPWAMYAEVKPKLAYEAIDLRRFLAKHALTAFRHNPNFPVITLLLMRGMIAAQNAGQMDRYMDAGLRAMWEDGEKMDDPAVFARVFDAAGLDGQALLAATQDPQVKQQLADNTEAAVRRGAFGVPTFFVGEEMFFGKDRLDQLEDYLARQPASA